MVYASWEDEPEEVWRRLSEISGDAAPWVTPERLHQLHIADMAGHGPIWAPSGSRHISALASITEAGEELRWRCEGVKARLLVLDPLAAAYAGDENARGLVRAFVSDWDAWGRAHGCAVLLVAHPPKSNALYAGSTDWQGAVRNMWASTKASGAKPLAVGRRTTARWSGGSAARRATTGRSRSRCTWTGRSREIAFGGRWSTFGMLSRPLRP